MRTVISKLIYYYIVVHAYVLGDLVLFVVVFEVGVAHVHLAYLVIPDVVVEGGGVALKVAHFEISPPGQLQREFVLRRNSHGTQLRLPTLVQVPRAKQEQNRFITSGCYGISGKHKKWNYKLNSTTDKLELTIYRIRHSGYFEMSATGLIFDSVLDYSVVCHNKDNILNA